MANEVGSLYVSIKADMSSITTSLSGLTGISTNVGRNIGLNISGGFSNALQTVLIGVGQFRNSVRTNFEDIRAESRSAQASFRIFRGEFSNLVNISRNMSSNVMNAIRATTNLSFFNSTGQSANSINLLGSSLNGILNGWQSFRDSGTTAMSAIRSASTALGSSWGSLMTVLSGLGIAITGAFVIVGVAALTELIKLTKDFIVEGVKYNAVLEQTKMSFEVMTQSAKKAGDIIKNLRDYADFSTFTTPQIADGAKLLMNYGVAAEDIMHVVRMLGDTSGGNAEKFKSQALAFGQIFARGRVTGDNLRQLTEAGINPMKELMQITGKTSGQLQDDLEAGMISVDALVKAFELATSAKGRFYNLQEKQSTTGLGMWSTIIDKFERFRGDTTMGFFESLKPILKSVIGLLDDLNTKVEPISKAMEEDLAPVLRDVLLQFMNLLGLSNGFDSLIDGTVGWVKALAGGIKVGMWLANLFIAFFGAFATGILSIAVIIQGIWVLVKNFWVLFVTLGTATILTIIDSFKVLKNNFKNTFTYVRDIGMWAFIGILNKFIEFKNKFATSFLGKGMNIETEDLLYNPIPEESVKGANELLNKLNEIKKINFDSAIEVASDSFGESFENLKTTVDILKQSALTTNGAFKNLFGDTSGVDSLLTKLEGIKKSYPKDEQKGIKTQNFVKSDDSAKKAADAIKKMGEEIRKAREEIVKFGDMFEKMTIERFSPSKILSRTRKFAKALAEFTMNMEVLKNQGASAELMNQIYGMGQKGWGLAKGLVRGQGTGQLNDILGNIAAINSMALGQGMQKIVMEHTGTIQLSGVDKNGAYTVGVSIAKDIRNSGGNFVK